MSEFFFPTFIHTCAPISSRPIIAKGTQIGKCTRQQILERSIPTACKHVVIKLTETHWSVITIRTCPCVRVCARTCALSCVPPMIKRPAPLPLVPRPRHPVLSLQTAVQTCATETASAPWGSRVGTANARQAGGDLAAVLRWRPLAPTTRTMKEVNWGEWDKVSCRRALVLFRKTPFGPAKE